MDNRAFLGGLAVGAAVALTLDPHGGGRRRALLRDKVVRGSRLTRDGLDATVRDIRNRARGMVAATAARFQSDEVDDVRLLERVRARLGRVCSHPHAVDVDARDGEVTLRGAIMSDEVNDVLNAAASVRGVYAVVNELEPHDSAEGIPSLQGEGRRAGSSWDIMQDTWAPATWAMVAVAALAVGGVATAYARR